MIWTLKKLVARRSARKATAPESSTVQDDAPLEAAGTAPTPAKEQVKGAETVDSVGEQAGGAGASGQADERAEAVDTAEHAARAEDALEGAGSDSSADAGPTEARDAEASPEGASAAEAAPGAAASDAGKRPAAKPAKRRRPPKLDPLLAAEVETARRAILQIAPQAEVGEHAGTKAEDDRVVTHLFESNVRGYKGWQWFAVLARIPRGKVATVSEVGLLPSERSLLSPEWVPWAERVRPEEKQRAKAEDGDDQAAAAQAGDDQAAAGPDGDSTAADDHAADDQAGVGQSAEDADVGQNGGSGGQ